MTNSKHQNILTLKEGEQINDLYLLTEKQISKTKNGRSYGSLQLSDSTGIINAKLWEQAEELMNSLNPGQVVRVSGKVHNYNGNLQLILSFLTIEHNANALDFLPKSPYHPNILWQKLITISKLIKNNHLQELIATFFDDKELKQKFIYAPAAKIAHHAYVHGLLEHTVSVASLIQPISLNYPHLNTDLLITGALLHDIGKIQELTLGPPLDYTNVGRLEGHLVLGVRILDTKLINFKNFPTNTADHLRHLILSHHGTEKYGSPVKPKTLEGFILHALDDLDAKTAMVCQIITDETKKNKKNNWSKFHNLLERHIFINTLL